MSALLFPALVFTSTSQLSSALIAYINQLGDASTSSSFSASSSPSSSLTHVAVSGGSFPAILATSLVASSSSSSSSSPSSSFVNPGRLHVWYSDERAVPLTHSDSNHAAMNQAVFSKLTSGESAAVLPTENVHVIDDNLLDKPDELAAAYQRSLLSMFPPPASSSSNNNNSSSNSLLSVNVSAHIPQFDCIFLGIGPDGHTASLFPAHPLLTSPPLPTSPHYLIAPITDSPKPPSTRITMTLPLIAHARHVIFVATGAAKKDILLDALTNPSCSLPCAIVARECVKAGGKVGFYLDADAASKLPAKL